MVKAQGEHQRTKRYNEQHVEACYIWKWNKAQFTIKKSYCFLLLNILLCKKRSVLGKTLNYYLPINVISSVITPYYFNNRKFFVAWSDS